MTHSHTGYSAPTSEQTDVSILNSTTSGSVCARENDPKKVRLTLAEAANIPVAPALVARATASNEVRTPTARASSSSSGVSVISTAERKKRFEMARLRRELAESRIEEEQAKIDLDAGSKAGSIARLDDVRSEGGDSGPAQRTTDMVSTLLERGRSIQRPQRLWPNLPIDITLVNKRLLFPLPQRWLRHCKVGCLS